MTLGKDYILPTKSLANKKLDYVALGHVHRHQVLNDDPPVVYSGSLERIDFGEEKDSKGFCAITISTGIDDRNRIESYKFVEVKARRFKTISIVIEDKDAYPNDKILSEIEKHEIKNAIVQVIVEVHASRYREISDKIIREKLSNAHFIAANLWSSVQHENTSVPLPFPMTLYSLYSPIKLWSGILLLDFFAAVLKLRGVPLLFVFAGDAIVFDEV
jgi:DNA repair exonuclease SbcCD nuclease subunit